MIGYNVTIDNSGNIVDELESLLPSDATEHSFTGILPNATYTVSITAVNGVGTRVTSTTIGKIFTIVKLVVGIESTWMWNFPCSKSLPDSYLILRK